METWFLALGLFLPRIALLVAYINGQIPPNSIPFLADVVIAIFIPRVLFILYCVDQFGWDGGWTIAHIIFAIIAASSTASRYSSGPNRRRRRS